MAGLAGAVAGAFYPTSPAMPSEIGTIVFVVVVVGGLGSLGSIQKLFIPRSWQAIFGEIHLEPIMQYDRIDARILEIVQNNNRLIRGARRNGGPLCYRLSTMTEEAASGRHHRS